GLVPCGSSGVRCRAMSVVARNGVPSGANIVYSTLTWRRKPVKLTPVPQRKVTVGGCGVAESYACAGTQVQSSNWDTAPATGFVVPPRLSKPSNNNLADSTSGPVPTNCGRG